MEVVDKPLEFLNKKSFFTQHAFPKLLENTQNVFLKQEI
jgi:hypothetical protein